MIGFTLGVFVALTLVFFGLSIALSFRLKNLEEKFKELTSDVHESRRNLYDYVDSEVEDLNREIESIMNSVVLDNTK